MMFVFRLAEKINLLALTVLIILSVSLSAQVTTNWQRSQMTSNLPSYINATGNSERGLAYGTFQGQPRLFLASTNGGNKILILDPATGDSVGSLNTSTVTGGTLALCDVEVSADGYVFATNLVTTSAAASPFKIYRWANAVDTPTVVARYELGGYRLGDKFTVVGSQADNSIKIYCAQASGLNVVVFSTTDNGATFTAAANALTGIATQGASAAIAPINNGVDGYFYKSVGNALRKVKADFSNGGAVELNMVPTSANSVKYFSAGGRKFVAVYCYGAAVTTTTTSGFWERALIYEPSAVDSIGGIVGYTSQMGTNTNSNGTGDVQFVDNGDGTLTLFVLSTNNGLGSYKFTPSGASSIYQAPYSQDFAQFFPPANWTRLSGALVNPSVVAFTTSGFVPDDFANITSPINRALKINIYGAGRYYWAVSPSISLPSGSTYQLEFDMALTKYGAVTADTLGVDDTLAVVLSTDNGATWSLSNVLKMWTAASPLISNTGQHEVITLPTSLSGPVRIAFYSSSTLSNKDNDIFFDNFQVRAIPQLPVFSITPTSKDFGRIQTGLSSSPQKFIITNTGAGSLIIQTPQLGGTNPASFVKADTNTYPKTLLANESLSFTVKFAPADTGAKSATITIADNVDANHTVDLTGHGADFTIRTLPYTEGFEAGVVPPEGWSNPGGYWNRGTESHAGLYCARVAYNFSTTEQAYLVSPPINLPANAQISFWWKDDDITQGKVANHDTTWFEISTDGGTNWITLATLSAASNQSVYEQVTRNLSQYSGNGRLIRWRDKTDGLTSAYGTGLDDISIVINVAPTIAVVAPNGGESWPADSVRVIKWTASNVDNVTIKYTTDNGTNWLPVAATVPAAQASYNWTVPNTPSAQCKVRVSSAAADSVFDVSDAVFTITSASLSVPMTMAAGWNMTSVPVLAPDMTASVLYSGSNANVFGYDNGYVVAATCVNGKGYWVRYANATNFNITGTAVAARTFPLVAGWNMVGILNTQVNPANVTTTPAGIINSNFFGFDNGYVVPTSLVPGKGYWVRTTQAGTMNLPAEYTPKAGEANLAKVDKDFGRIVITDALGHGATLYAVPSAKSSALSLNSFDMPPVPPAGVFDVRFGSQRSAENISSSAQTVSVNGATYPLTIRAEGVDLKVVDKATSGKLVNQMLKKGEQMQIGNAEVNAFDISEAALPTAFELAQNYPNPFNPTTNIRFGLPEKAHVTVTVYNQIGEKIAVLINGEKEAGYHTITWNAAQLSSGIYFYELKTEKFSAIKKLMLVK